MCLPNNSLTRITLTVKLNSGDLEISGDTGTNATTTWNGIWEKAITDGSSKEQAIALSITKWKNGSVATGEAKWYKFEATSGTSYRVQWKDKYEKPADDSYTAWVKVTAYQSNGTTKISTVDEATFGWESPKTISSVSGTVYIKVEPYNSSASYAGTYTIRFFDPAIVVPQIPMSISYASATPVPTVVVSWNYTSGVSGYRVYRSNTETGTYTQIGTDITNNSTTRYTDTNVTAGNTYWYKVAAYNSVGEGNKSDAKQSDTVPATSVVITTLTVGAAITDGTLSTATQIDWYKFEPLSGKNYNVQWADSYQKPDGSTYTGDIKVSAFKTDGSYIFLNSDSGWTYPSTIYSSSVPGTVVYLKVESYGSKIGTYGIKVFEKD
jgi:hypothetical protein